MGSLPPVRSKVLEEMGPRKRMGDIGDQMGEVGS